MKNITLKFYSFRFFLFIGALILSSLNTKAQSIKTTGVTICKGGSGVLTATSVSKAVTTFSGHWNPETDPKAFIPYSISPNYLKNSTVCRFWNVERMYTKTTFVVTVSGTYDLKMTDNPSYDGMAYIYTGDFNVGSCEGNGTWIIGDAERDGNEREPHIITNLEAGVVYTLVSTVFGREQIADYTWQITPPVGGEFFLNPLNYWYTSRGGGTPIGWGNSFNPVGVPGSGLANTNTSGTTTFYVSTGENSSDRTPIDFVINEDANVTQYAFGSCIGQVFNNKIVGELTVGKVTGIGTPVNLPAGLTLSWSVSDNTLRLSGSPTELGEFWFSIPLITDCGNQEAIGNILVDPKPDDIITYKTICSGEKYIWPANGIEYSTSQTGVKIINDGCKANQVLNLTVIPKPADIVTEKEICFGKTFKWAANQITYSESTELTIENDGCTANQTLKLTVKDKPLNFITLQEVCYGESFYWDITGMYYDTSGMYYKYDDGCTGNQILKLIVKDKPLDIITNIIICAGEKYTWEANGIEYTTSQTGIRIVNDGCTADQVLNLTVTPKPAAIITNKTICPGKTYIWPVNGIEYTTSQTELKIINDGCTADQILNLIINENAFVGIDRVTICEGQVYIWPVNNQSYTTSQSGLIYSDDNCTRMQMLFLEVKPKPEDVRTEVKICPGETYIWPANNQTYSTTQNELKFTQGGCTADQILNLTVNSKPADVITKVTVCSGEKYIWPANGFEYTTSQTGTRIVNDGCTADQVLNLTVTPKPAAIITNKTICSGEKYTWPANGIEYTTSQTELKIINDGCTADQILNLIINENAFVGIDRVTICEGQVYIWPVNNQSYTTSQSGLIYSDDNCTRMQMLFLEVKPKPEDVRTEVKICPGETYTWPANNQTYSTTQNELKFTQGGCTADQILNLTVNSKPADVITNITVCSGEKYIWPANGFEYTTSQTGTRIVNDGCTTDQVLNLTVTPKPAAIITNKIICLGETYIWPVNGIEYATSQTELKIVNDGCTADQVLNLTVNPKPADIITNKTICPGETYTWPVNGIEYATSQNILRITNDGCTADQILNLAVQTEGNVIALDPFGTCQNMNPGEIKFALPLEATGVLESRGLPPGTTVSFANNMIIFSGAASEVGNFEYWIFLNGSCNVIKGDWSVFSTPTKTTTIETICEGQSYTWSVNGATYSTAGIYTKFIECQTYELKLIDNPKPQDIITNMTICSGEKYTWPANGIEYTTTQTGLKIINEGCTADQILNLNFTPKPQDVITNVTVCSGEKYSWEANGIEYTTTQTGLKIINDGCTADQILNLNFTPKPQDVITNVTVCSGEKYTWPANEIEYTTSQTGTRIVNDRCNADQVLNLNVIPKPQDIITTQNICAGQNYTWIENGFTYTESGIYRKTNNNCSADQVLHLNIASALNLSLINDSTIPESCNGINDGEFSIKIEGGNAPYTVSIDNTIYEPVIGTDHTFSTISGGGHVVYIKDALDCNTQLEVTIPNSVTINPIVSVSYDCFPLNSVSVFVDPNIASDVDYVLDDGIYQQENIFTNLSPGLHKIKARHLNGCIKSTESFTINDVQPLKLSFADGDLNEIIVKAEGGSGAYQYKFEEEPFVSSNKFNINKSGNYSITVMDENACQITAVKHIEYVDVCIPNYFTPNGDGNNDEWGPDCTVSYKNLSYIIYDRYGRVIGNYKYGQKWDGKYNGNELTSGDYWYVLKLNDLKDNREFIGHFTLYR